MTAMTAPPVPVVDADGHVIEPPDLWQRYVEPAHRARAPRPVLDENGLFCYAAGDVLLLRTASRLGQDPEGGHRKVRAGGWDASARLADMDLEGIASAFLFPSLAFFFPELGDPPLHAALCRAYNDWLHDYCQAAPERLFGIALLPLEDVPASVRELERATSELGLRGAFFRPNPYAGRPIQHPAYEPVWQCAEALGVPITVHEGVSERLPTLGRDRSESPVLHHLFSHPFEQMAACAGLILGGVLDRHPSLRFAFLESGCGWVPYWLERMDGHFETWGHHVRACKRRPSEAFAAQCFVSMEPDERTAPAVLSLLGDEAVVFASDYPHTDHVFPGVVEQALHALGKEPEATVRKVLAGNARRLYGGAGPAA
jgi:predicted TIM-barrel fold metal-dependent hydrolase